VNTWAGGGAQVLELLPSKYEAMSSNPSTAKINKLKKINKVNIFMF
jgi:hypothetical protein